MAGALARRISTRTPIPDLARQARADVARHGVVVLIGRRSQARQLRRLQAALRGDGYQAGYFTDGADRHVLEVSAPDRQTPRAVGWWGLSN